jgi:hypothetical protein
MIAKRWSYVILAFVALLILLIAYRRPTITSSETVPAPTPTPTPQIFMFSQEPITDVGRLSVTITLPWQGQTMTITNLGVSDPFPTPKEGPRPIRAFINFEVKDSGGNIVTSFNDHPMTIEAQYTITDSEQVSGILQLFFEMENGVWKQINEEIIFNTVTMTGRVTVTNWGDRTISWCCYKSH